MQPTAENERSSTRPVVWLMGLSGSGKTTLGKRLVALARTKGLKSELIDGDSAREFFGDQSDYTRENRIANIKRIAFAAKLLSHNGVMTVVANLAPFDEARRFVRSKLANYSEVYLSASLEVCESRDPKGLYAKARRHGGTPVIGIDEPFEAPENPDCTIDTGALSAEESFRTLVEFLTSKGLL